MKTNTTLPNEALEPVYEYLHGEFTFYESTKAQKKDELTSLKLPKWANDAIKSYVENECERAIEKKLKEIRKSLGCFL